MFMKTSWYFCEAFKFTFSCYNWQILTGGLPYMTKGPFALFFGGNAILPELSDGKAGRHVQFLCLFSVIFNLSILCRKQWFFFNNINSYSHFKALKSFSQGKCPGSSSWWRWLLEISWTYLQSPPSSSSSSSSHLGLQITLGQTKM